MRGAVLHSERPGRAVREMPLEVFVGLARARDGGDAARTAATGAGLGLAIVEKALQRMGGTFEVTNAPDGGLVCHLRLKKAP